MDSYSTNCDQTYKAIRTSGTRKLSQIKWIILHDEEAPTAESAARYFTSPMVQGSAHLCVDDTKCFRTLQDTDVPWAAPGANVKGFHIEQAGYARWSAVIWKSHFKTLNRAAYKTAFHCHKFGIPPKFILAADLKAGKKGVSTHAECTKAFGGTHTDPGPLWPRTYFMSLVRKYYVQLTPAL